MLNTLIDRLGIEVEPDHASFGRLARAKSVYRAWRAKRDIAAISGALNRLSNRRLRLIGMHRHYLDEAVVALMTHAEDEREIGREIVALLEGPKRIGATEAPRRLSHDVEARSAA